MRRLGGAFIVLVAVCRKDELVLRVFPYGKENQAHEEELWMNGVME
jgi:hypothetical protein